MKNYYFLEPLFLVVVIGSNKPVIAQAEVDLYLDSVNVYVGPYGENFNLVITTVLISVNY